MSPEVSGNNYIEIFVQRLNLTPEITAKVTSVAYGLLSPHLPSQFEA